MELEIYADIVCPWCWIGEKRLLEALSSVEEPVNVRWRAFQLDPTAESAGAPLIHSLAPRYGGDVNVHRMFGHVTEVASGEGLTMDFDRAVSSNTFDAHRLIWFARGADQWSMVEALHKAHFTDGLDVGSRTVLASIAASLNHDHQGVLDFLHSQEGVAEVRADLRAARDLGITGVPTFVFNGRYGISGAQDVSTFREILASLEDESVPSI